MSFALIGTAVTKDIILSSISTSVSATTNVIKYLLCYKESELDIFKKELFRTDLCNNLQLVSSIIDDIIKNHNKNNNNNYEIEKIEIINNDSPLNESCLILHNDYKIKKKNINFPEPVKQILFKTYETIEQIKKYLEIIQFKIHDHENKYLKNWRSINIKEDVNNINNINLIFEKRMKLLFEVIKIYKNQIL
jgi:hypothetical protein